MLIYVHKEQELDDVERWRPARRYVMVDDKLRLLAAIKQTLGRKGHDGLGQAGPLRPRSRGDGRACRRPTSKSTASPISSTSTSPTL